MLDAIKQTASSHIRSSKVMAGSYPYNLFPVGNADVLNYIDQTVRESIARE